MRCRPLGSTCIRNRRIVEPLIVNLPRRHAQCEEPVSSLFHQPCRTTYEGGDILRRQVGEEFGDLLVGQRPCIDSGIDAAFVEAAHQGQVEPGLKLPQPSRPANESAFRAA
jgi:hypothetical protein